MTFRTGREVPKVGLMLVGWGGNNGSTVTATVLANKHELSWKTKGEIHHSLMFFGATVLRNGTGYLVVFQIFSIHP